MKIGEAAKKAGISPGNIRFYEKKGLLKPSREESSSYRNYTEEDVDRLKRILILRKTDLSCRKYFPASGWKRRSRLPFEKTGGNSGKSDERTGRFSSPLQKTGTGGRSSESRSEKYLQFIQKEEQEGRRFSRRGTPW